MAATTINWEDVTFGGILNRINVSNRNYVTVGVHNGVFHADDILCVVLLKYAYASEKEVRVVRSRDINELAKCDYILDVGNKDEITNKQVWLDHHNEPKYYDNGLKYAACGKLADYLFQSGDEMSELMLKELREQLLWPIEVQDNGQNTKDLDVFIGQNKFSFVNSFNPSWLDQAAATAEGKDTSWLFDEAFNECVKIAYDVFFKIIESCWGSIKAIDFIKKSKVHNNVLYLDFPMPWQKYVIETNTKLVHIEKEPVKLVVFKGNAGWCVQVVPKELGSFEAWINMPENWAGKRNEEFGKEVNKTIPKISETDCVFCHMARFLSVFKTKEAADMAAQYVVSNS